MSELEARIAAIASRQHGPFLVDTALQSYLRSRGTRTKLEARLDAVAGRGCRGVGVLRKVLHGQLRGRPLGSPLEVLLKRLLDRYGKSLLRLIPELAELSSSRGGTAPSRSGRA